MDIRNYFKINNESETNPIKNTSYELNNSDKSFEINCYENKSINSLKVYEVFTDGSTFNNGQKKKIQYGGIGIYFNNDCFNPISETLSGKITNNIAELKACIKAIEFLINQPEYNNNHIHIYTDSEYTINSIVKWSINWEKNGWINKKKQEIANKELIILLYNYYKKFNIKFIHVRAHTSKPKDTNSIEYKIWYGNYAADLLARDASKHGDINNIFNN